MDTEKLRSLRLAYPFKPFELVMEDGRRFLIDRPPYLAISPLRNVVLVATGGPNVQMFRAEWIREAVLLESKASESVENAGLQGRA